MDKRQKRSLKAAVRAAFGEEDRFLACYAESTSSLQNKSSEKVTIYLTVVACLETSRDTCQEWRGKLQQLAQDAIPNASGVRVRYDDNLSLGKLRKTVTRNNRVYARVVSSAQDYEIMVSLVAKNLKDIVCSYRNYRLRLGKLYTKCCSSDVNLKDRAALSYHVIYLVEAGMELSERGYWWKRRGIRDLRSGAGYGGRENRTPDWDKLQHATRISEDLDEIVSVAQRSGIKLRTAFAHPFSTGSSFEALLDYVPETVAALDIMMSANALELGIVIEDG